jgi:hypothetical protein
MAKNEQLMKARKAPQKALTCVMRKLMIFANALLKNKVKWQPSVD